MFKPYRDSWKLVVLALLLGCDRPSAPMKGAGNEKQTSSNNGASLFANPTEPQIAQQGPLLSSQPNPNEANYRILMIGNSHTYNHGLASRIGEMINTDGKNETAFTQVCPGGQFLNDRLSDPNTIRKLDELNWTHVVLQAQQYSTSGKYTYPTSESEKLAKRIIESGAKVVFYPEWSQRGNPGEGKRVYELHLQMASRASGTVAPVGIAWELALAGNPTCDLYDPDGNHASKYGAFVTASVIYSVITGRSPEELSDVAWAEIAGEERNILKRAAWSAVQEMPAK